MLSCPGLPDRTYHRRSPCGGLGVEMGVSNQVRDTLHSALKMALILILQCSILRYRNCHNYGCDAEKFRS